MDSFRGANCEYRDRLFKFIFGNPENKEWTLSLYNAVNGSSYTNPDDITLTTIEDAVYMSMKNDVSFLIADTMSLYEQQSTFNPNMPMRFLVYAGMTYSRYMNDSPDYHKYSSKQQQAPTPKCVCFYNGKTEKDDTVILKLSDSFKPDSKSDIEVTVTMLNINYGRNKELMKSCQPLHDYSFFVEEVRMNKKQTNNLEEAIDNTLRELPDDSVIKPFLLANKAEVKHMCITEYDEERTLRELREDSKEEGRAEGRTEGMLNTLIGLVKDGILTLTDAASRADMTVEEFEIRTGLKA